MFNQCSGCLLPSAGLVADQSFIEREKRVEFLSRVFSRDRERLLLLNYFFWSDLVSFSDDDHESIGQTKPGKTHMAP